VNALTSIRASAVRACDLLGRAGAEMNTDEARALLSTHLAEALVAVDELRGLAAGPNRQDPGDTPRSGGGSISRRTRPDDFIRDRRKT
jgi:hypothetical protein